MTCQEFLARLTAFSLGELDPAETELARRHLLHCGDCAAIAARDQQLLTLLRSFATTAPEPFRQRLVSTLRASATTRSRRARHWLAVAAAAALAAAAAVVALVTIPAPDQASPLAAAWEVYRTEPQIRSELAPAEAERQLAAVLGAAARPPDLSGMGLEEVTSGARALAGHLAAFTEYRDRDGNRVALLRWRGQLPDAGAPGGPGALQSTTWGQVASVWWESGDRVWCLVGTLDQARLWQVAEHLRQAGSR